MRWLSDCLALRCTSSTCPVAPQRCSSPIHSGRRHVYRASCTLHLLRWLNVGPPHFSLVPDSGFLSKPRECEARIVLHDADHFIAQDKSALFMLSVIEREDSLRTEPSQHLLYSSELEFHRPNITTESTCESQLVMWVCPLDCVRLGSCELLVCSI